MCAPAPDILQIGLTKHSARDGRPAQRHLHWDVLQVGAVAPNAEDGGERGAHLDASEELRADAEVVRDKVEECVAARGRRLPQEVVSSKQ